MRVIAGAAHGRRLRAGKGQNIRPTAAKVKGAIFNIVVHRWSLEDAEILDLFAGAGALGIEALSRGARRVTFVERDGCAVRVLRDNLRECRLEEQAEVIGAPVDVALRRLRDAGRAFDGVFLDPPYEKGLTEAALEILGGGLVRPEAWIIAEHAISEAPGERFGNLRLTRSRRYGKTALSIFEADAKREGA